MSFCMSLGPLFGASLGICLPVETLEPAFAMTHTTRRVKSYPLKKSFSAGTRKGTTTIFVTCKGLTVPLARPPAGVASSLLRPAR